MIDAESATRRINSKSAVLYSAAGITAILVGGLIVVAASKPATATPAYAAQTKLACGRCHASPAGGGSLTGLGKAFAGNGHKLPKKQ
jgi:mono/diheme cytochrome c family protein